MYGLPEAAQNWLEQYMDIYIYIIYTKLSVTPVHCTVQEGLSILSCREGTTKSKRFLVETFYSDVLHLRASSRPSFFLKPDSFISNFHTSGA